MSLNQYAVYQIKPDAELRQYRYKSYQQLLDSHLEVDSNHYRQVFLTTMVKETSPDEIRRQLETRLPPKFLGNALNVSDVIAITKDGISTAYYVDKVGFVVIPGFFRFNSSTTLITMNTAGFVFEDRKGSWMATDEMIVDGKQFFLMASEAYGNKAAFAVVDAQGRRAAEDTVKGFDEETIRQIRQYLHPEMVQPAIMPGTEKPPMEIWQKYYENGEYLRAAESYGEQNFDMIDGRANNRPKEQKASEPILEVKSVNAPDKDVRTVVKAPQQQETQKTDSKQPVMPQGKRKRRSVLKRLREKQAEIAARSGGSVQEQEKADMERNRK